MRWVGKSVVLAIHDEQIAEHGGRPGLRDLGLLESALARPPNLAAYGQPDVAALAAAYAYGIARNHPFIDGNKRVSFVVVLLFLALNGYDLDADPPARVDMWLQLANGSITEDQLASWLRAHLRERPTRSAR